MENNIPGSSDGENHKGTLGGQETPDGLGSRYSNNAASIMNQSTDDAGLGIYLFAHHERTQYARAVLAELLEKYAGDSKRLKILQNYKVVEFSANTFPEYLTDPDTGKKVLGNQEIWDKIRALFTHDKNNLPPYIPALEFTGIYGSKLYRFLLTVCHPDSGTPSTDPNVEYCINCTREDGTMMSYMSYAYAVKHLKNLPSSEVLEDIGWTSESSAWNWDLMRLDTYLGGGRQVTKWYAPERGYGYSSTQSSFWTASPGVVGSPRIVFADYYEGRLCMCPRFIGFPSLVHA